MRNGFIARQYEHEVVRRPYGNASTGHEAAAAGGRSPDASIGKIVSCEARNNPQESFCAVIIPVKVSVCQTDILEENLK